MGKYCDIDKVFRRNSQILILGLTRHFPLNRGFQLTLDGGYKNFKVDLNGMKSPKVGIFCALKNS